MTFNTFAKGIGAFFRGLVYAAARNANRIETAIRSPR